MAPRADISDAETANRVRLWLAIKTTALLGGAALAAWAVWGKADELSGATSYFSHLDWGWLAVALIAELLSFAAFAVLQQRLLAAGTLRSPIAPIAGITLAGNAIQNSLPAGLLLSSAYSYRQYRRLGADEVLSAWVMLAVTCLSLMSLSLLAAVGLALAASSGNALDLVSVIVGLLLTMAALTVAWAKRRWILLHAPHAIRLSQRISKRPAGDADDIVRNAQSRMVAISPSRQDWSVAGSMAAFNWVLDLTCLVTAFLAVNATVPWRGMLLAYGAAQLASTLPVTPGGLGVVEGSLTIALVAFGGAEVSTVAAVLLYRLLNFWMMLPVGWVAWGAIALRSRRRSQVPLPHLAAAEVPSQ